MRRRSFLRGSMLAAATLLVPTAGRTERRFPVTVRHALGETVVPSVPRRVVSIGLNDHDFLYALGIAPVGVREWWGGKPFATWSWAEPARRSLGAEPAVMGGRIIDPEWVLSLNPDLIVATYGDLDSRTYRRLSRIAPVIGAPAGFPPYSAPWRDQIRLLGLATSAGTVGADAIIADIARETLGLRAAYPNLDGRTASFVDIRNGQFTLWSADTSTGRFLAELGLIVPDTLSSLADRAGWIRLSFEHAALLNLDLAIWPNADRQSVEAMNIYRDLRLCQESRSIFLSDDPDLSAALWFQSPLSLRFVLSKFTPLLSSALQQADGGVGKPCGNT